jgi:hypothetical protein
MIPVFGGREWSLTALEVWDNSVRGAVIRRRLNSKCARWYCELRDIRTVPPTMILSRLLEFSDEELGGLDAMARVINNCAPDVAEGWLLRQLDLS